MNKIMPDFDQMPDFEHMPVGEQMDVISYIPNIEQKRCPVPNFKTGNILLQEYNKMPTKDQRRFTWHTYKSEGELMSDNNFEETLRSMIILILTLKQTIPKLTINLSYNLMAYTRNN